MKTPTRHECLAFWSQPMEGQLSTEQICQFVLSQKATDADHTFFGLAKQENKAVQNLAKLKKKTCWLSIFKIQ